MQTVAIIGAGPAGLIAARYIPLRQLAEKL